MLLSISSPLRQSLSFRASQKELIDWLNVPGLSPPSQVVESVVLLLSPPVASAQLSFRKRLRQEATDVPELIEFLDTIHSRPLLAWRYEAYSNHDVFLPVQVSSTLQHAPGDKNAFLINSTPYSCGLYEIGGGIVREANPEYCCERCDGPTGLLLDEPSGHKVGWDIGTLVSIGSLDEYGAAQLMASNVKLPPDMDSDETLSRASRPALLALLAPWALS